MSGAEQFASVLRDESVRRVDNRYVHHAVIRDQMRDLADRIERWERGDFQSAPTTAPQRRDGWQHGDPIPAVGDATTPPEEPA